MIEIKTCGVVGYTGMVGGVVYKYFQSKMPTFGYSGKDKSGEEATNSADIIFISVPTPYRWGGIGYDDAIVDEALNKIKDGAIVVIKSTIQIGRTDYFQLKYPNLRILFNPEFLSELSAYGDFISPDRQFVGYTKQSYSVAIDVLHLLPESPYDLLCPAKEAELLKFINNMHGVIEVMESNHYFDVCEKEGLNYDRVIKAAMASKWVGPSMGRHYRTIFHKGYRGVGGTCFPKDLNSWLDYCERIGIDAGLLRAAKDVNVKLLEAQGLTEAKSELIKTEADVEKIKKESL